MKTISMPKCPRCIDGGNVTVVKSNADATGMFEPLPKGWEASEFQCECGWSMPLEPITADQTEQAAASKQ